MLGSHEIRNHNRNSREIRERPGRSERGREWLMLCSYGCLRWEVHFCSFLLSSLCLVFSLPPAVSSYIFSYAGLHCVVIKGFSKSAGYQPGFRFDDNRFRNTWNAVCLDGSWRFVQCNWGARHLVSVFMDILSAVVKSHSLFLWILSLCYWSFPLFPMFSMSPFPLRCIRVFFLRLRKYSVVSGTLKKAQDRRQKVIVCDMNTTTTILWPILR